MHSLQAMLTRKEPVTWLFAGDSITHGALHTLGWRDYTELFRERVIWELRRQSDVVINTAFSGYSTRGLLAEYDLRIGRFTPDVVFIMIGMNDCSGACVPLAEFSANLRVLVERVQRAGGLPVLQTTCPVVAGKAAGREEHLPAYMDAVRQAASALQVPLIDHHADWDARGEQRRFYLMSDPFHPNECGHRAFAQRIFRDAGIWDDASYMCRLFVP
jgi:lysophospholipase L1-like esterase